MDIIWLLLVLCAYMLVYFYLGDYTHWTDKKIAFFWFGGLVFLIALWLVIDYLNPDHPAFPGFLRL